MNQIIHHDFGLFDTALLSVDYICLNLPNPLNLPQAAFYFQALGFSRSAFQIKKIRRNS